MEETLLALDTATGRASVAICRGRDVLAEGSREVSTHSEGLLPLIDELVRRAGVALDALGAIVCGRGPGSFTGVRIGLSTAKGLCLAAGRPLVCVSSLLPLAAATAERCASEATVVTLLDARRGEVFAGLWRGELPLGAEVACRPERLPEQLPAEGPLLLAGDGALRYSALLLELLGTRAAMAGEGCHAIEARYLARAALPRVQAGLFDDLATAVPVYLRPSDARLPAPRSDEAP